MAKILLVEDDINLREIYAARLSAENYKVVSASDGEEALAVAVKEKPSLILLDIMMPKISGFDVLDILRSTPATRDSKVIMLTALSQKSDRERGEQLGVDKYLVKSQITLEDVVQTIKDLLGASSPKDRGGKDDSGSKTADDEDQVANKIEAAVKSLKRDQIKPDRRQAMPDDPASNGALDGPAKPPPGTQNPNHN
ncbi:response regulator, partial [Candidatus Microgenomates bacterium]|nr:response regulator [Candidatus Microgenomates bacterium]